VVTDIELDHVQIAAPPECEAWFALGDRQLHIGVAADFEPARKAHLALRLGAADLDVLAQRLAESGAWPMKAGSRRGRRSSIPPASPPR
jgi:hypothetical protein